MTKLFVIVLNFNNGKDIITCLQFLIKSCPRVNTIVVDNGSTDGSMEKILKQVQDDNRNLKIIENKRNLGFAKGMNKGIRFALKKGAERVLLLNPDTEVNKGFLEPLLTNGADVVGPIIKFKRKGQWVYDFGGKVNWWLGRSYHLEDFHLGGVMASLRSACHHPRCMSIDYVSGACMLIRRKVFEKIGFLDERYFLFFEDADFCLRAQKTGFKVALEPKSMILHKLSEGKKKPLYCLYHLIRSNLIFVNTWLPFYRRPLAYLYLVALGFKMLLNRL